MTRKRIFSGIKPSGELTIGNYLGAIKNWIDLQDKYDSIFCIVDMHAITVPQDRKKLLERTYKIAAIYLACGVDEKKAKIFIQSHISEHAELAWILNCFTYMGEMERMTQFKDKSKRFGNKNISVGLFGYPVLMAADILLYDTNLVPVGEDQVQHIEIARDIAKRFNGKYGNTFVMPEPYLNKSGARIMGLDNPENKMDKSADSAYNYILIEEKPDDIRKKIAKAVTDSGKEIVFDERRGGLYNLLTIYKLFSDMGKEEIEAKFAGKGYGDFKKDLAEIIVEKLSPIQQKYNKLITDKTYLDKILVDGAKKVRPLAQTKLDEVKRKIGFIVK